MTEDEAKTKWCPHARVVCYDDEAPPEYIPPANRAAISEAGHRRINNNPETSRCIASACMAWRWTFSPRQAEHAAKDAPMAHSKSPFVARGYCGLAGSPS